MERDTNQDLFSLKVFLVATGVLGLLFLGLTWLSRGELGLEVSREQDPVVQTETESPEPEPTVRTLSQGEQILRPTAAIPLKEEGAAAIATGDYDAAIAAFDNARTADQADPETLIYLNNAQIGDEAAHGFAVVAPLETDPAAAASILRGVAQAQDEINGNGGIAGKPIRVFLTDDQGNTDRAEQIATELSQNSDVIGIIGHHSSATTEATGSIYQAAALPFVSTSLENGNATAAAPLMAPDLPIAEALAFYMDRLNHKTVILFFDGNSDYSQAFRTRFAPALSAVNGTMTAEIDLANIPDDLAQNPPEAEIFLLSPGNSPLETATNSIEIIPNDQVDHFYRHIFGGHELFHPDVLDLFGSMASGTILAVPNSVYESTASPFNDAARNFWGESIDWTTAASYNTLKTMASGLEQDPSRVGAQGAISNQSSDSVRLLRVRNNPDQATGYELLPVGTMTANGFSPE